ncbi:MAG TPA: response regulator transcription factor [Verrucomicrobiota bacterium]|nr:response regulator transcription factor [Verrucomicrobiota bacterium]HNU51358.1 response regulator transcription factor [Verrucomicrobiota bacterium]
MDSRLRICIVDDHPIVRQGLRQALESDPRLQVIGEAGDGAAALDVIRSLRPDVAVVDIEMPHSDGLCLARALEALRPSVPVLILSMHKEPAIVNAALDAGAKGYLLKENAVAEVVNAVKAIAAGECYLCPGVSGLLLQRRRHAESLQSQQPGLNRLTPTERRVLRLIAENLTSRQIARQLFVSIRTVETHRANICSKLGLHGFHPLLQFALEHRSEMEPPP